MFCFTIKQCFCLVVLASFLANTSQNSATSVRTKEPLVNGKIPLYYYSLNETKETLLNETICFMQYLFKIVSWPWSDYFIHVPLHCEIRLKKFHVDGDGLAQKVTRLYLLINLEICMKLVGLLCRLNRLWPCYLNPPLLIFTTFKPIKWFRID